MEMTRFFQQHKDALKLISEIEAKINNPSASARELAESLITFSARLKHHLTMEDMYLYPKAIASKDTELTNLASKMRDEMVPISSTFVAYIDFWGPKQIEADRTQFTATTRGICDAVRARIATEEAKFYPMAEKLL